MGRPAKSDCQKVINIIHGMDPDEVLEISRYIENVIAIRRRDADAAKRKAATQQEEPDARIPAESTDTQKAQPSRKDPHGNPTTRIFQEDPNTEEENE